MFFPACLRNRWQLLCGDAYHYLVGRSGKVLLLQCLLKSLQFTEKHFQAKERKQSLTLPVFRFNRLNRKCLGYTGSSSSRGILNVTKKLFPLFPFPFTLGVVYSSSLFSSKMKANRKLRLSRNSTVFEYVTVTSLLHFFCQIYSEDTFIHIFFHRSTHTYKYINIPWFFTLFHFDSNSASKSNFFDSNACRNVSVPGVVTRMINESAHIRVPKWRLIALIAPCIWSTFDWFPFLSTLATRRADTLTHF